MSPIIVLLAALVLPLALPNRLLLTGLLALTGLMTILTIWGLMTATGAGSDASTTTTFAVLGLIMGAVLRLGVFLWTSMAQELADRRQAGRERELPQRYR